MEENDADTPQFRGGNPYFFCENLYQSVSFFDASMYLDTFHEIRIAMQFAKKTATLRNKNRQPAAKTWCYRTKNWSLRNWSFTSCGATVTDIGQSRSTRRNLPFFGNLAGKASCVDDKTVVSLHILNNLFFRNLPQIRITT